MIHRESEIITAVQAKGVDEVRLRCRTLLQVDVRRAPPLVADSLTTLVVQLYGCT